ncbi:Uncharacterised protein [uncultured archaeon]|nr:Uncharacterised protein [uncultured archaeon]
MIKLIVTKSEKMQGLFLSSVKKFKSSGVCVLVAKPYSAVKSSLKSSRIFFIDTLAESSEENVIHVPPSNLTALSIAINQALQSLEGKKFLAFDSFSTLTVRNPPKVVSKFALFLLERIRSWDVDTVIIVSKESTDAELLAILKQSVDKVEEK